MAELTRVILAQSNSIKALQVKSDGIHATVKEIKPVVFELQKWKPEMEPSVEVLRSEVGELRTQVVQISRNPVLAIRSVDLPPLLPLPEAKPELESEIDRMPQGKEGTTRVRRERHLVPFGHQEELAHWERTIGEKLTVMPPPGNGKSDRIEFDSCAVGSGRISGRHHGAYHHHHPPPKLDFPPFDGENPKAWQLKCENYFMICLVQPEFGVSIATMYFVGGALLWLQSSRAHTRFEDWDTFVEAVCNRFAREEFQQLVRQFNQVR